MGEIVDLQTTLAGQFGYNDWLGQQDNAATPKGSLRVILPVQEMRAFQRRYRFDSQAPNLGVGERWTVTWIIPQNEWWRILAIQWLNGDTVSHIISVRAAIDRSDPIQTFRASRFIVESGIIQLVYGLDDMAIATNEYFGRFPAPLQPGDTLFLGDQTVTATANQSQYTLIYELVPRPVQPTSRGQRGIVGIT